MKIKSWVSLINLVYLQETVVLTSDDDCNHGLCFGYEWIVSDWSGVSYNVSFLK